MLKIHDDSIEINLNLNWPLIFLTIFIESLSLSVQDQARLIPYDT